MGLFIGSDVLRVFELREIKLGNYGELYVIRIDFGWVVNGLLWKCGNLWWIVNLILIDVEFSK